MCNVNIEELRRTIKLNHSIKIQYRSILINGINLQMSALIYSASLFQNYLNTKMFYLQNNTQTAKQILEILDGLVGI